MPATSMLHVGEQLGPLQRTGPLLQLAAGDLQDPVGQVEVAQVPALQPGQGDEADVGVDGDGVADGVEQRAVVVAVAVRPRRASGRCPRPAPRPGRLPACPGPTPADRRASRCRRRPRRPSGSPRRRRTRAARRTGSTSGAGLVVAITSTRPAWRCSSMTPGANGCTSSHSSSAAATAAAPTASTGQPAVARAASSGGGRGDRGLAEQPVRRRR